MDELQEMNPYRMHRFNIADLALDHRTVRAGNEEEIGKLVHSISNGKKIDPIYAPLVWAQGNRVLDGYDRIEAALRCGRQQIWCRLLDCDSLEAEAIGIDANLVRKHLSTAEQDELLWRRKQLHLIRWPQTGHGHNPKQRDCRGHYDSSHTQKNRNDFSGGSDETHTPQDLLEGPGEEAFSSWMAEKLETSRASVQKGVQRGQLIAPEDRAIFDAAGIKTSYLHDLTRAVLGTFPPTPEEILALPDEEQPVAAARWRAEQGRARAHEVALLVKSAGRRGIGTFKAWIAEHMPPRETRQAQQQRRDEQAAPPKPTRRRQRAALPAAALPSGPDPTQAGRDHALYGYATREDLSKGGPMNATGATARDRAPSHRVPCDPRAAAHELHLYFRYDDEMERLVEALLVEWGAGPAELAGMLARHLDPEQRTFLARLLVDSPAPSGNGRHREALQHAEKRM